MCISMALMVCSESNELFEYSSVIHCLRLDMPDVLSFERNAFIWSFIFFFSWTKIPFRFAQIETWKAQWEREKKNEFKTRDNLFPNFRIDFHGQWFQTTLTISYTSAQLVFDSFRGIFSPMQTNVQLKMKEPTSSDADFSAMHCLHIECVAT